MTDLAREIARFLVDTGRFVWRILRPRFWPILYCLVIVALLAQSWATYRRAYTREITIYIGNPGSNTDRAADRYSAAIRESHTTWMNYRVRVVPTQGNDDIEARLAADTTGLEIGVIQDRPDEFQRLAVLLPLGWDYLHVLCSRRFLKEVEERLANQGGPQNLLQPASGAAYLPIQLSQVAPFIEPGRVFMGPLNTAARRLSELVLEQVGVEDPGLLACHGVKDWNELRPAFLNDHIDVAFYPGVKGNRLVDRIAGDNTAVLLSLKDLQEAIAGPESAAWVVDFSENQYATPLSKKAAAVEPEQKVPFCPKGLATLASRRVLAASRFMANSDAYAISRAVQGTEYTQAQKPWEQSPASAPAQSSPSKGLMLSQHPGTVESTSIAPTWWFWRPEIKLFAATIALYLATELVQQIRGGMSRINAPPKPTDEKRPNDKPVNETAAAGVTTPVTSQPMSYDEFDGLYTTLENEIHQAPRTITADAADDWHRRLQVLRRQAVTARRTDQLTETDFEFLSIHAKEVRSALELKRVPKSTRAKLPVT
jgi:hypothetical protein